jgi:hypothetical protein
MDMHENESRAALLLKEESHNIQPRNSIRPRAGTVLRIFVIALMALAGLLILTFTVSRTDYIAYWSAGTLLLRHADPYSARAVYALEKVHGLPGYAIMLNPPWALFLAAPLGIGKIRTGFFMWTLLLTGCVVISARLSNVPPSERVFAYVFAPAVAAVFMGQSSAYLLLGFSLFLYFYRNHPFLAGASLLLMAIKPHLFLVFWAILLVDCIYRRAFLILAGFASSLAMATAFALCFDPRIWPHYFAMLRTSTLNQDSFPTLSSLVRVLIYPHTFWLLFIPSGAAVLWAVQYYARHRQTWNWQVHGMLLMLVTILVSPYSWLTDEAVLLPSIIFALASAEKRRYSAWILLAINSVVLYIALVRRAGLITHEYCWTSVTWLIWFLYATYKPSRSSQGAAVKTEA